MIFSNINYIIAKLFFSKFHIRGAKEILHSDDIKIIRVFNF